MIPRYPRVCPDLYYVESEGSASVFTKEGKVNLQSQGIGVVLKALTELADGSRSWENILNEFPEHLQAAVTKIMDLLSRHLILRDGRHDNEFALPESLVSAYRSTLSYLRCHLEASSAAFMRFRTSKVLLTGEGAALLTAATCLHDLGLENATVVLRRDDEFYDTLKSRLKGSAGWQLRNVIPRNTTFDLIASIGSLKFNQEIYAKRKGLDSLFLPICLSQSHDYIGPLKDQQTGACLQCLESSIQDVKVHGDKGPMVRSLTGARAAWEILKIRAGVDHENLSGTIAIHAEDLSDRFHRIFSRYSCECQPQNPDLPVEPEESMEDLAEWAGHLINPHSGPIPYLDPENIRQLPVNYQVLEWQKSQPRVLIPGRTLATAKVDGVVNGLRLQLSPKPTGESANPAWQASAGTSVITWVYNSLSLRRGTQSLKPQPLTLSEVTALADEEASYWIKTLRLRYGLELSFVLELFKDYQIYALEISKADGVLHRGTGLTALAAIKEALLKTLAQMDSQSGNCGFPIPLSLSAAHSRAVWMQWYANLQKNFKISLAPELVLKSAQSSVVFVSGWVALYERL